MKNMQNKMNSITVSRAVFVLLLLSVLSLPLFAQSCASSSDLQPTQLFTEVTSKTGSASAFLTYENFSTSPARKPVHYAPIVVHIYNDTWDGEVVRFYTNFEGEAALDLKKHVPSTEGGCYTVDFIFCSPYEYDLWECLEANWISSTLLQPYKDSATASGVVDDKIYGIAHIPADTSLFSDTLKPWLGGQLATEGYKQMVPLNLKTVSDTQQYCPIPEKPPAPSLGFCLPLILIFALLGAGMFMKGQNPFGGFDFSTPRMGKLHSRYGGARGRGAFFDIAGTYSSVKGAVEQGNADIGALKESGVKASWSTLKSDIKSSVGGLYKSKAELKEKLTGQATVATAAQSAAARVGVAAAGRRRFQLGGLEGITSDVGMVSRARAGERMANIQKQPDIRLRGAKGVIGSIAAGVFGRTELGLVRSEEKMKEDFMGHKGGVAGAQKDINGLAGKGKFEINVGGKIVEGSFDGEKVILKGEGGKEVVLTKGKDGNFTVGAEHAQALGLAKGDGVAASSLLMNQVAAISIGMNFSVGGKLDLFAKINPDGSIAVFDKEKNKEVTLFKIGGDGKLIVDENGKKALGLGDKEVAKYGGAILTNFATALQTLQIDARERKESAHGNLVSAATATGGVVETLKKDAGNHEQDVKTAKNQLDGANEALKVLAPLSRLIEKVEDSKAELKQLNSDLSEAKERLGKLEGAKKKDEGAIKELKAEIKTLTEMRTDNTSKISNLSAELVQYGGYEKAKAAVDDAKSSKTAAEADLAKANQKVAETKAIAAGLEDGSILGNSELLKKVIDGHVHTTPEVRKAVVEYVNAVAVEDDAKLKMRPAEVASRVLSEGEMASVLLQGIVPSMQSTQKLQEKAESNVRALENIETYDRALVAKQNLIDSMKDGDEKKREQKNQERNSEYTSVLKSSFADSLLAHGEDSKLSGEFASAALNYYLFAKEVSTKQATGEAVTTKDKEAVAAKEAEMVQGMNLLSAYNTQKAEAEKIMPPVKLDEMKTFADLVKNRASIEAIGEDARMTKIEYSQLGSELSFASQHLEHATDTMKEIKREGREGSAKVETAMQNTEQLATKLREEVSAYNAAINAGAIDLAVSLASLGGKTPAPVFKHVEQATAMQMIQYEQEFQRAMRKITEVNEKLDNSSLPEEKRNELKSELEKLKGEADRADEALKPLKNDYEAPTKAYESLTELCTAVRDSNVLKTESDKAKVGEWVEKIGSNDASTARNISEAVTSALSGKNLEGMSDEQRKTHAETMIKLMDAIPQSATGTQQPAVEEARAKSTDAAIVYHQVAATAAFQNPEQLAEIQKLGNNISAHTSDASKGNEEAAKTLSAEVGALHTYTFSQSAKDSTQAQVLAKAPEHELQLWAERHSHEIEKSPMAAEAYKAYQAAVESNSPHSDHFKNRFIQAVSQLVPDKAVDNFVKEQYVRQWVAGSHGQEAMQNIPDLQKAVQDLQTAVKAFQSRPTNDMEYGKHVDDLYQKIQVADQPFREQRQRDFMLSVPVESLHQFAEQHKPELQANPDLAKAFRDFTKASHDLNEGRETFALAINAYLGTVKSDRPILYDTSPRTLMDFAENNPDLVKKRQLAPSFDEFRKAEDKAEQAKAHFAEALQKSESMDKAVTEFREREMRKAEHETQDTRHETQVISQHETERYLNTDWENGRKDMERRLTEVYQTKEPIEIRDIKAEQEVLRSLSNLGYVRGDISLLDSSDFKTLTKKLLSEEPLSDTEKKFVRDNAPQLYIIAFHVCEPHNLKKMKSLISDALLTP